MSAQPSHDPQLDQVASTLMDVLIRGALILGLVLLCFRVFSPFLALMAWAVILAVTLYPMQEWIARRYGVREGLAATLIVLLGVALVVAPMAALMSSLGDTVRGVVEGIQSNTLRVPPPRASVESWPLIGDRVYAYWTRAYNDLPALVESMQPKIGNLAVASLGFVAGIGGGVLKFLGSLIVAGVMMAFGESGARAVRAIFEKVMDGPRGAEFVDLSTATIRAVAKGVLGVAFLQAIIVGVCMLVAGVPLAGVLAVIVLVLGVAQVPAVLVTLPAIAWLWMGSGYGTGQNVLYTIMLLVAGMTDNVLKPLMLGRGVDAPMPVILLGALGGMATGGILGMFVGATGLALGYQVFVGWVATEPDAPGSALEGGAPSAG